MAGLDPAQFSERLKQVHSRIGELRGRADAVEVIAVTKGFGTDALQLAADHGLAIGENYAQELLSKLASFDNRANVPVHFIGQLQTNKVRSLVDVVDVWQSVDRTSLIDELAKRAPGARMFVQVNVSDDARRGGCAWGDVETLVHRGRDCGLDVCGLMTVGLMGQQSQTRSAFRRLVACAQELDLVELSIGMSDDWEMAVEEGATVIRLGRALFGDRKLFV